MPVGCTTSCIMYVPVERGWIDFCGHHLVVYLKNLSLSSPLVPLDIDGSADFHEERRRPDEETKTKERGRKP